MHVTKDEGARMLTEALREIGLTVVPALKDLPEDGYIRIIRSGSLVATILANVHTPGLGSDTDLALLINRIKRCDLDDDVPR